MYCSFEALEMATQDGSTICSAPGVISLTSFCDVMSLPLITATLHLKISFVTQNNCVEPLHHWVPYGWLVCGHRSLKVDQFNINFTSKPPGSATITLIHIYILSIPNKRAILSQCRICPQHLTVFEHALDLRLKTYIYKNSRIRVQHKVRFRRAIAAATRRRHTSGALIRPG